MGIGILVFIIIMNAVALPASYELIFSPKEAFAAYYFFWDFMLGRLGIIIGTFLLFLFIMLVNYLVILAVKRYLKRKDKTV